MNTQKNGFMKILTLNVNLIEAFFQKVQVLIELYIQLYFFKISETISYIILQTFPKT